jgi:diguanylate cyclase (GGDEF)-like protein
MIIDGVLGSQCVDSSGEVLDVEGADILDLEEGRGVLNYEHKGAEDKDSNGQEIVGKIVTAKKIFSESDCDNARQKAFWKKVKHPFIYGVCRLYDGAGHEGAKALAAQIRDHHANSEPILVRFSVEGSTLEKDGNVLKRSVIRRVALTLKPCNRTADSGLIEDPHAPTGFDKKPVQRVGDILADLGDDAKKMEHQHPGFMKLGGVTETEYSEFTDEDHQGLVKSLVKLKTMKKMLEAGSYDAAPSSLTQGAALQREDRHGLKNRAMKALKSYLDKNDKFDKAELVTILKQDLPEASDDFINHFAGIAEDYHVKLRKREPGEDDLGGPNGGDTNAKILTPDSSPFPTRTGAHPEDPKDTAKEKKGTVPPARKGGLEMKGGKLIVPPMKFKQHFPNDHIYQSILDPDWGVAHGHISPENAAFIKKTVHEPWHRAMKNWMHLNNALKDGKVPKGVLAKSVIFAAMSPNTSVPKQERFYGHYIDMLNEGLVDPFRPMGEDMISEFTRRSTNGELPKWNRAYWEAHPFNSDGAEGEEETDTEKGELPQIAGLRSAHLFYPRLEDLVAKYGDNTQQIAADLMHVKHMYGNKHDATHPDLHGYGPKLVRYILGMIGGGNMIVPDRHMIRSTFDLQLEPDPDRANKFRSPKDLAKLQEGVFTEPRNERFLRAIDHNFFVKHPAVRHVLEQFPKHFAGREQQAIFPAFWLHWLTTSHYDQMRNRPFVGFNADTDHQVYWDSVRDEMIRHGLMPHPMHEGASKDPDDSFDFGANLIKHNVGIDPWDRSGYHVNNTPVWMKAAGAVHALALRWGETPALFAFFSHMLPKMMKAEAPAPPVQGNPHISYHPHVLKMESMLISLKKAMAPSNDQALREVAPHVNHVYVMRVQPDLSVKRHPAGRFLTAGKHLHVLEDYHRDIGNHLTEGPLNTMRLGEIEKLKNSPRHEVVPLSDIMDGKRPDLWIPQTPRKPASAFEVHRPDQTKPDHLEFVEGKGVLNGHPIEDSHLKGLLDHAHNGHVKIRYKQGSEQESAVKKMELVFQSLMKNSDPESAEKVHAALDRLDQLVKAGHLEPHHAEALRAHAFKDPGTGNVMGNKFAYQDFLNRADSKGGVHVVMDGNDFKSVNDRFGHETGDRAIGAFGHALRSAMDESVGKDSGKLFRVGGDEFAAHVPSHEHAARFARTLRSKLDALAPIEGTHKLSMGLGFGVDPVSADQALYEAKKQKYHPNSMVGNDSRKWVSKYPLGAAPSFAHSHVPGFEGPVPLDTTQLHVKPPPAPMPKPPAPAPVIHTPPEPKTMSTPAATPSAPAPRTA